VVGRCLDSLVVRIMNDESESTLSNMQVSQSCISPAFHSSAWQEQAQTVQSRISLFDNSQRLTESRVPDILQKLFPVNAAIPASETVLGLRAVNGNGAHGLRPTSETLFQAC
jgi:hypothetical protein